MKKLLLFSVMFTPYFSFGAAKAEIKPAIVGYTVVKNMRCFNEKTKKFEPIISFDMKKVPLDIVQKHEAALVVSANFLSLCDSFICQTSISKFEQLQKICGDRVEFEKLSE